jgi:hypothetical protein
MPGMKVLSATTRTQGVREGDFDWTIEGELVWVGVVCARDQRDPDGGGCGCGRSFSGLSSHRATTTAQVSDLDLTRDDVLTAYAGYLESAGYGSFAHAELADEVDELLAICATWHTGEVIERRLDLLRPRTIPAPGDRRAG